jgi:bacterioferritin
MSNEFVTDITALRARARAHMERGAVIESYKGNLEVVLRLLNEALATEIVCVLRYKRHHYQAKGIHSLAVAAEFLEHAAEEQGHADQIAARITQLGGAPDFSPAGIEKRSHSEYVAPEELMEMIKENLVAERIAIESYGEMIRFIGLSDPTTSAMLEGILATEEEHAEDMVSLLATLDKETKSR